MEKLKKQLENMMPEDWQEITIREQISCRGGGVEISLDCFGFPGEKMTAYQNYLGGGLLGKVCSDCTLWDATLFMEDFMAEKLDAIAEALRAYFHSLTNPDEEEQPWESMSFDQNQNMPTSAY